MKVFEAIGKGFGLAGKNVSTLILLFVFNAVWNIATFPFIGNPQAQPGGGLKVSPQVVILSALFILLNIFIQGGVLGILKDSVSGSGSVSLAAFAKYGKKFYGKLLSIGLIITLAVIAAVLIIGLAIGISAAAKNVALNVVLIILGLAVFSVASYYLFLFFMAPYALVLDDSGIVKAFENSKQFVKKYFWKVAWLSTLVILIAFGIAFLVGMLSALIALVIKGALFQVITGIFSGALSAYITIIVSGALVVYYHALSGAAGGTGKTEEISA